MNSIFRWAHKTDERFEIRRRDSSIDFKILIWKLQQGFRIKVLTNSHTVILSYLTWPQHYPTKAQHKSRLTQSGKVSSILIYFCHSFMMSFIVSVVVSDSIKEATLFKFSSSSLYCLWHREFSPFEGAYSRSDNKMIKKRQREKRKLKKISHARRKLENPFKQIHFRGEENFVDCRCRRRSSAYRCQSPLYHNSTSSSRFVWPFACSVVTTLDNCVLLPMMFIECEISTFVGCHQLYIFRFFSLFFSSSTLSSLSAGIIENCSSALMLLLVLIHAHNIFHLFSELNPARHRWLRFNMIKPSGGEREHGKKIVEKNIDKNQVSVHVNEWVSGLWPYRSAAAEASREQAYKIQKVNFSVVKFDNLLFWFSDLQIWWCDGAVTSVAAAASIIKTRYYQKSIRIYLMLLFTILSKAKNFRISFQGFWLLFAKPGEKVRWN